MKFMPAPGYQTSPRSPIAPAPQSFPMGSAPGASAFVNGPTVDLGFWQRVIASGNGPITGPQPISPEIRAMRAVQSHPYEIRGL